MTPGIDTLKLCDTIKRLMRQESKTNAQLGETLGVSLATAKRIIGCHEALSVERLFKISQWLGIAPDELLAMARDGLTETLSYLTDEQETLLASDDGLWALFNFLYNGLSIEDIQKRFKTPRRTLDKLLLELERHGLIKVLPSNAIQIKKLRGKMRPGGPLFLKHFSSMANAFAALLKRAGPQTNSSVGAEMVEPLWFKATDYEMHREDFVSYAKELQDLLAKYGQRYTWAAKAGALKDAGRLYGLSLYFWDAKDDPEHQAVYTGELPAFFALKGTS